MEKNNILHLISSSDTFKKDDTLNRIISSLGTSGMFKYNNQIYKYQRISSLDIQRVDHNILLNEKLRDEYSFTRTLKLACNLDYNDIRYIIASEINDDFISLVSFSKDGTYYIMDYSKDLIMSKDDYYKLLDVKEYASLNKFQLYRFYVLFIQENSLKMNWEEFLEFVIFNDEIFKELGSKYEDLASKYDVFGMNKNNYAIVGDASDSLFIWDEDYKNLRYEEDRAIIEEFTLDPEENMDYVDSFEDKYHYSGDISVSFELLSSISGDKDKERLHSMERYGHCHFFAMLYTYLYDKYEAMAVGGKIKRNDVDFYYHSWVEVKSPVETLVLDYSHNIIMNKDKYYELFGAVKISEIKRSDMIRILDYLDEYEFSDSLSIMFFGNEMLRDLDRNKNIFKRKLKKD